MSSKKILLVRVCGPALVLGLMLGCGQSGVKTTTVDGRVTYNGADVESGTITFTPADAKAKGTATQGKIRSGRYSVGGVSPGKNRVVVSSFASEKEETQGMPRNYAEMMKKGGNNPYGKVEEYFKKGMTPDQISKKVMADQGKKASIPENAIGNGDVYEIDANGKSLDLKLSDAPKKK